MSTPGISLILAQAPAATPPPGGGGQMLITMVLFMVIFWVLIIRPQKKKQKEHEAKLAALKPGDQVVTAGGIHGIIMTVRDRSVTLKIAEGVRVELEKSSVMSILAKDSEAAPPAVESAKPK